MAAAGHLNASVGPHTRFEQRSLVMTTHVLGRRWLVFLAMICIAVTSAGLAFAQSVASGTIEGTAKDESGAILPGVTITLTSPQLQVGQLTQVSDRSEERRVGKERR